MVILHGKESYLQVEHVRRLRQAAEMQHDHVDVIRFDGATTALADILDEARSLGLMQQYKILIVDQADELLKIGNNRSIIERFAKSPPECMTLVLRADTWRAPKLNKLVAKVGRIINCETPTPAKAVSFCRIRCPKKHGCDIEPQAADLLVQRIGPVLARLDSEMARLALMVGPDEQSISADLVHREVARSREERAWEVQQALLSGQPEFALRRIRDLLGSGRQPGLLLNYAMTDLARKLYSAARLRRAGITDDAIAAKLKLWGSARYALIQTAARVRPERLAQIMRDALHADARAKSGFGERQRSLDMLALRFLWILRESSR